jgi:1,4-alpha-glucan branching enzyme
MLYLDYNRLEGEWEPNQFGGNENLEAVSFLRELNQKVKEEAPDCMMIAEESTAWPAVTAPVESGGLGFDYKWNMGWMNDTLKYMTMEEEDRTRNTHRMTFPITYAFGEKYILPLSHDEVVHLKGSILQKMPGNKEEKLMQLRAYIGYMMAHPGKKLLFMGGEMAQETEWDYKGELPWSCLEQPDHENYFQMIKSLNHFYRNTPALWQLDHEPKGFEWIDVHKAKEGLLLFERLDLQGNRLIVVSNFSKKIMRDIPLPRGDHYQVAFSTNPNPGAITITEKGITIPGYTTGFITREVE